MDIGIIGLGLLGRAIAVRLLDAGYEVCGYDLSADACAQAAACGVAVLDDGQAVAEQSDLLLLSLLTSENRRALFWGEQDVAPVLPTGLTIMDTTTARPDDLREDAARLEQQGVRLVDVCVSGSSQAVLDGRALVLVGDDAQRAEYAPVLETFSRRQFYLGAPGRGNEAKLVVNLVHGLHRAVLSEALGLAAHAGFDLATMLEILREGDTYSAAMDTKGPMMLSRTFEPPVSRLAQHTKDVRLILEFAQKLGAPVPLEIVNAELLEMLVEEGYGHLDNAAIFKAYVPGAIPPTE